MTAIPVVLLVESARRMVGSVNARETSLEEDVSLVEPGFTTSHTAEAVGVSWRVRCLQNVAGMANADANLNTED